MARAPRSSRVRRRRWAIEPPSSLPRTVEPATSADIIEAATAGGSARMLTEPRVTVSHHGEMSSWTRAVPAGTWTTRAWVEPERRRPSARVTLEAGWGSERESRRSLLGRSGARVATLEAEWGSERESRRSTGTGRRASGTEPESGRKRSAIGGWGSRPRDSSCVAARSIETKYQPLAIGLSVARSNRGLPPEIDQVVSDVNVRSRWLSGRNCTNFSVVKGISGDANRVSRVFTRFREQHPRASMFS